ncbi:hypothetical protein NDR87_18905 [Nocardia sp. CDC159]|uniref:Uncharacterized protein n=1 Tax=Nocardia pulmonis TaxID=2951408 RepID=A0A9X2E9H6_9NOCA|nr:MULTISPECIES: hypothetical protein [Nocardia]MCM6776239.1 hypothetical protein [Nocardia pulmonis]MCM6788435.1 hypothetical protein [Nocardia sp. CDC159]
MTGSAYRTALRPTTELGPFVSEAAVYALYPPIPFQGGIPYDWGVTSYVIVSSAMRAGDTQMYACTENGDLLSWVPLEQVPVADHRKCLRVAGYELEEVAPRGAA